MQGLLGQPSPHSRAGGAALRRSPSGLQTEGTAGRGSSRMMLTSLAACLTLCGSRWAPPF